jgi:lipoyl(octanoyl) transferase/putative acetyltransferase
VKIPSLPTDRIGIGIGIGFRAEVPGTDTEKQR